MLPVITNPPASQTVAAGANATLSVGATGTGLSYQWLFNGAARTGATNQSLTISNVQPADVGAYTVRVRNSALQEVESQAAILEIGPLAGVQSVAKYQDLFGLPPNNGFAAGKSKNLVAAVNEVGFIPVGQGTTASQILNNRESVSGAVDCGVIGGSARWVGLTPTSDGTLIIDTAGSGIDTVLAVFTNNPANLLDPLVPIDCATNAAVGGQNAVQFQARQGVEYFVAVDGNNSAQGVIHCNWRFGLPPVLAGLPTLVPALRAARDGSVTLVVNLSQADPYPDFQWLHNSTQRTGATRQSLTLFHLQPQDAGEYSVVVSNLVGVATGQVAIVMVDVLHLRLTDSRFDSGTEGWTVAGQAGAAPPDFGLVPNVSGGYLSAHDTTGGATWYWRAPIGFLGNQSAAYGGYLAFDLKQTFSDQQFPESDVILIGGGLTLVFSTSTNPGTDWTSYQVPLSESAGWRLNNLAGRQATQEELLRTLASLTNLLIRGKYSHRLDAGDLDNVALVAPSAPLSAILVSHRVSAHQLVFEWPVLGGFQLEAASTLPFTNWATLAPLSVSNGLNSATIDTSSGSFFFRLSKP
ncbi:MAG TPA: laminin B domain-containing protein, partial [Verrucomicrobiae bacterium]